jgi:hypothetical protein
MLCEQQCLNLLATEGLELLGDKTKFISPTDGVSHSSCIILWLENLHTLAMVQVQKFLTEIWLYLHTFDGQSGESLKLERESLFAACPVVMGAFPYTIMPVIYLWRTSSCLATPEMGPPYSDLVKKPVFFNRWACTPITESVNEMNACLPLICELFVHRHSRHDHFVS